MEIFERGKFEPDTYGSQDAPHTRINLFVYEMVTTTDSIYSDLSGKFPVQSESGNK